jgi:hypothetical protein
VFIAISIEGDSVSANADGQLLATDATTVSANAFFTNAWIGGYFGSEDDTDAYVPNAEELRLESFEAQWFAAFPTQLAHDPMDFFPAASAPWLDRGALFVGITSDRNGTARQEPVDLGPFEQP